MSLNLKSSKQEAKPEKTSKSAPKWLLPAILWVAAFACVGFMGIVIAQRTPVIRGSEESESGSVDNSLVENIVSNPSLPEMNAIEVDNQTEAVDRLSTGIRLRSFPRAIG